MDDVARLSGSDRSALFRASGAKRGLNTSIIEKDFWVCWALKRVFTLPALPAGLVFKGGTSLSKVYKAIERFSEDVDLSFDRNALGFGGQDDPAGASSRKKQQAKIDELVAACTTMIREQFVPVFQRSLESNLGRSGNWRLELDPDDHQTVLFYYPPSVDGGSDYVRPFVRLEMGARGEQWPSHEAEILPYAAEDAPSAFRTPGCTVRVIDAKRTFWEKATILHMWHHADPSKRLSDRQSRHYYDLFMLYRSGVGRSALADLELLRRVSAHKAVYFSRPWARFDLAVPGTLRLVPPETRLKELARDFDQMREEMIFGDAPDFPTLLVALRELEQLVNQRQN